MWWWLVGAALAAEPTIVGVAHNAKGGPVVVPDTGGVRFVLGIDRWPAAVVGQAVAIEGTLGEASIIPTATRTPEGVLTQGKAGTGPDPVVRLTRWTRVASQHAAEQGLPEPAPWRVAIADGSGNVTTLTATGEQVQWSYSPVVAAMSSSGTYSGGDPAEGQIALADTTSLWTQLRALTYTDGPVSRPMGSVLVTVKRPEGEGKAVVLGDPSLATWVTDLRD